MAQRLMTMWWQTSGSSDQLAGWLDRHLSPVSGFTIRRYHVDVRDVGMPSTPPAPWLYIVHTDIPAEIVTDYNAWYDEEHLPRLVSVPGVIRARRYVADDGVSPRYLTGMISRSGMRSKAPRV